jgi:hypothetical protein
VDPAARKPSGRLVLRFVTWLGLVAGAAFGLAPAASASPGWTAPSPFPTPLGETITQAATGFATGGTATVAFIETGSGAPVLHVGTVAPGAGYAEQLSLGGSGGAAPVSLSLAVAGDGAAVLAWELAGTGAPTRYEVAFRPSGDAGWSAPVTLALDAAGTPVSAPARLVTAIAPDGTAAAAVEHPDPSSGGQRIDAVVISPAGAAGPPSQLGSAGVPASDVSLGFGGGDSLTATFISGGALEAQTWTGGGWSAPGQFASAAQAPVQLAVSPDGSAAVAFDSAAGGPLELITRSGGDWSGPIGVSTSGAAPLAVGLAADDTPYVLFSDAADGCTAVGRDAGGSVTEACLPGSMSGANVGGIAFRGTIAYLGWGTGSIVQGASWAPGDAGPGAATTLDRAVGSGLVDVSADGDGSVGVLWMVGGGLRAAAFDAGAPILIAADVPGMLPALQTASFTATFTDLWSGVGSITWSFGDGTPTTSGAQSSHAYAAAGAYPVTATAADGLGNTTTQRFAVTVGPPSPRLSRVSQSRRAWKPRQGTVFRFSLSEAAQVTFTFMTAGRSRRLVGLISVQATPGPHRLTFHGRIGSLPQLRPGRYGVTVVARLAGESSSSKRLAFTILPAR